MASSSLRGEQGASRNLKVMSLHGWRTNKGVMSFQLHGLKLALSLDPFHQGVRSEGDAPNLNRGGPKDETANWVLETIDAPHKATGPPFPEVAQIFGESQDLYFQWWDMQKKSEEKIKYHGIEESLEFLFKHLQDEGPVDILAGFSQGAIMASVVHAKLEENPGILPAHLRPKCFLFMAGGAMRDTEYLKNYFTSEEALNRLGRTIPSIHAIADKDKFRDLGELLLERYEKGKKGSWRLIRYPEPHQPPTWKRSPEKLKEIANLMKMNVESRVWWAFDFDGVLCDSARETGMSGIRAGRKILPKVFDKERCSSSNGLVDAFVFLRPLLEHGYHAIVLNFMVLQKWKDVKDNVMQVAKEVEADIKKRGFEQAFDDLKAHGLEKEDLQEALHAVRDEWMESDFQSWLSANSFYDEAVSAVASLDPKHVYIITTKHKNFADPLLKKAGLKIPEENLFGQGMGAKEDVIEMLSKEKEEGKVCFFIEDRIETLTRVAEKVNCRCRLAFASWGYSTTAQKDEARSQKFDFCTEATLKTIIDRFRSLENIEV